MPEISALSAWETKIIVDVLISRRKKNACLGNCYRTLLLISDIFYTVKRLKSTADLNLLVLPRFPWQCPLTLGRNHSAKNISTPITAINHDIFLGLYLTLVPNRRDPSKTFLFLYIELSNSFLIGRKRIGNFRNLRLWHHNCRLDNNHVKDTKGQSCHVWPQCMIFKGNHVNFDRFVLLAVSEEAET